MFEKTLLQNGYTNKKKEKCGKKTKVRKSARLKK